MPEAGTVFVWPQRVYYDATDAGGVVYHAKYLEFMERARTEFLRALGYHQSDLRETEKIVFVVSAVAIDYLAPARFDDALSVTVLMESVGRSRIIFVQEVRREEEVLVRGRVTIACVNAQTFRPTRMPEALVKKFNRVD